jgi:hypothetical protein
MTSKHGMSSDKARRVKNRGMRKEFLFKSLLSHADVVKGNKQKRDVQTASGITFSLKGGEEKGGGKSRDARWQWFLLSDLSSVGRLFGASYLLNILGVFPGTRKLFEMQRAKVLPNLGHQLDVFINFLQQPKNLRTFFFSTIFDGGNVDCLGIQRDDQWHIFSRDDILDFLVAGFSVQRNRNRQKTGPGEKIVFVKNSKNFAELEVRRDKEKYVSLLFTSTKNTWLPALQGLHLQSLVHQKVVILYGKAMTHLGEFR